MTLPVITLTSKYRNADPLVARIYFVYIGIQVQLHLSLKFNDADLISNYKYFFNLFVYKNKWRKLILLRKK